MLATGSSSGKTFTEHALAFIQIVLEEYVLNEHESKV